MMHFEEVVVTIVDSTGKPFRELNSQKVNKGRKCDIFVPVDTEYKFLVKNNSDRRIKLDIDIDGSTVSGNGLILNAHQSEYIERFVDVAKKFKTSRKDGEGVADPTSPENGIIKVRVNKEKLPEPTQIVIKPPVIKEEHHHHHHYPADIWWNRPLTYTTRTTEYCSGSDVIGASNDSVLSSTLRSATMEGTKCSMKSFGPINGDARGLHGNVTTCCYSAQIEGDVGSVKSFAETLATVEGSHSNQNFTWTNWIGNDLSFGETVFTFFMRLAAHDPEYEQYLLLKKKYEGA
jgi:hypothetical protein